MNNKFFFGMLTGMLTALVVMLITFFIKSKIDENTVNVPEGAKYISVEVPEKENTDIDKKESQKQENDKTDKNGTDGKNTDGTDNGENKTVTQENSSDDDGKTDASDENAGETLSREEEAELFEKKLNYILYTIDENFYDGARDSDLYDGMLRGLVNSLNDPYSQYYSPEELEDLRQKQSGEYVGMGALISQNRDTKEMLITYIYAGSPAEKAGLLVGDEIIAVNGENVVGQSLEYVSQNVKGPSGEPFDIVIKRDGKEIPFTIVRGEIEQIYVAGKMLDDDIGYIVISAFYEVTYRQFCDELDKLTDAGMKSLIIDLRDNPGGLYDSVCSCLDRMLESGKLLVYEENKKGKRFETYSVTDDSFNMPVAILVNENSASAAEIFTMAMQEYNRATIIGTKTFGKGIVQNLYSIKYDNSAVKLTISKYFSPNGVCIHKTGVSPDIYVEYSFSDGDTYDSQTLAAVENLKKKMSEPDDDGKVAPAA